MYRSRKSVTHRGRAGSRRLSFFDVHDTRGEVAALEAKLLKAIGSITAFEEKEATLVQSMADLQTKYDRLLQGSMFALWEYCPSKSSDFRYIPSCDHDLHENEKEIGEYIVHSVIGSGHSSTVYCCLRNHQGLKEAESGAKNYVRNGNMVALKTLEKKKVVSLEDLFKVEREVEALSLLSPHQNIVRYYHTLHGSQRIYILMECYPSDLFDFIGKYKTKLSPNVIAHIVHEILLGLKHLAANSICHRDLKPENILVFMDKNNISLKICDFGLCSILPDRDTMLTNFRGSPGFFAPESLLQPSYCGFKADLFSVGCIALEMLVTHRFFKDNWMSQYKALQTAAEASTFADSITRGLRMAHAEVNRKYGPTLAEKSTKRARSTFLSRSHKMNPEVSSAMAKTTASTADFVELLLNFHPHLRPCVEDALKHKWVQSGNKLQLLDTLHDREETSYIQIPRAVASLRQRGDGKHDIDDDDDDDDVGVSRTRTTSICELTLRQEERVFTSPTDAQIGAEVEDRMSSRTSVPMSCLGSTNRENPSGANEVSLPVIVDQSRLRSRGSSPSAGSQDGDCESQHSRGIWEEKKSSPLSSLEHTGGNGSVGIVSPLSGLNTDSADRDQVLSPMVETPVGLPPPGYHKLHADAAVNDGTMMGQGHERAMFGVGGVVPFSPITSGKSTPFGTPLESPINSNVGSRASTPPLPFSDADSSSKLVMDVSYAISATSNNNNSGISDIFRKYKESDDQAEAFKGEPGGRHAHYSTDTVPGGNGESLTDKLKDISSLVRQMEDRAVITARVIEDTLTVPPIQGASLEAPALKPLDVSDKKMKMKKVSPPHADTKARSPKMADSPTANPEKSTQQRSKPLSPVEAKGESPAGDGKSPYLTTKPHHTFSPHNFHVSKVVPGRLII